MAVNVTGAVDPVDPVMGLPLGYTAFDANGDNIADVIDTTGGGNNVFFALADSGNPAGGSKGLAWNDPLIWPDYDYRVNVRVGYAGTFGQLEINSASALRPISFAIAGDGPGRCLVTGWGSELNLDPEWIAGQWRACLAWAKLTSTSGTPDPAAVTYADVPESLAGGSRRYTEGEIPLIDLPIAAGGRGVLEVLTRAVVPIRNRLLVGTDGAHAGLVLIDSGTVTVRHQAAADAQQDLEEGQSVSRELWSHVGARSGLLLRAGGLLNLEDPGGLVVDGVIDASEGDSTIAGDLQLDGLLRVRCGATLTVTGEISGSGEILLDAGARIDAGQITTPGLTYSESPPYAANGSSILR